MEKKIKRTLRKEKISQTCKGNLKMRILLNLFVFLGISLGISIALYIVLGLPGRITLIPILLTGLFLKLLNSAKVLKKDADK